MRCRWTGPVEGQACGSLMMEPSKNVRPTCRTPKKRRPHLEASPLSPWLRQEASEKSGAPATHAVACSCEILLPLGVDVDVRSRPRSTSVFPRVTRHGRGLGMFWRKKEEWGR